MIAQTAVFLFFLGAFALFVPKGTRSRLPVLGLTACFLLLFGRLAEWGGAFPESVFSVLWDTSPAGDVRLELRSTHHVYFLLLPFFAITAVSLVRNALSRDELPTHTYIGWAVLNLLGLIFLAAGHNFIQMITFVFVVDISSQFLIKNMPAGRCFALFNLIADMGLFWVLALLNGNVESLNVTNLRNYHHRDLVAVLLMFGLFIKFGFCLWPTYIKRMLEIRLNRRIVISFVSAPAVAWILMFQLHTLLEASPLFRPVLNAVTLIVMAIAGFGMLRYENFGTKIFFFNAATTAFLVKLAESAHFVADMHFAWGLVLLFTLNLLLYELSGRQIRAGDSQSLTPTLFVQPYILRIFAGVWLVLTSALTAQTAFLIRTANALWCAFFVLLFIPLAADMFCRLRGSGPSDEDVVVRPRTYVFLGLISGMGGTVLYQTYVNWSFAVTLASLWLLCLIFDPLRKIPRVPPAKLPEHFTRQVKPCLENVSKEKQRIAVMSVENMSSPMIGMFRKISRLGAWRYVIWMLIGVCLLLYVLGRGRL